MVSLRVVVHWSKGKTKQDSSIAHAMLLITLSSTVIRLRDTTTIPTKPYTTNDIFRFISLFIFFIFTIRFYWKIKYFLQHNHDYLPIKSRHRRTHRLAFVQTFGARFVLHVLGGCGAIWGCSEAVGLRHEKNSEQWRVCAALVGIVLFIRWLMQVSSYCLMMSGDGGDSCFTKMNDWMEILVVKVIVEVFGAAGAIWGFSQIVLLRTDKTTEFWQKAAVTTLVGFTIRWLIIVTQFIKTGGETNGHGDYRDGDIVSEEDMKRQDSEINDLALTETQTLRSHDDSPPPYEST